MIDDFFNNRLDQIIDLPHPLEVLSNRMPCQEIEELNLFSPISAVAGDGISNTGWLRMRSRLMVAFLELKHVFNESNEDVM
jgi:IS5 family transposase